MRRLVPLAVLVASLLLAPGALAGGGPGGGQFGYGPHVAEARAVLGCAQYGADQARYSACLEKNFVALIEATHDPADELPKIDTYVHSVGGWLQLNCHVLMHTVGRRYAIAAHVNLANLLHYLPKSNDPGCSAGFSHGMLIALGPAVMKMGPKGAAAKCAQAATRYEQYSCVHGLGHAYARTFLDHPLPALNACRQLGPNDAADCAQGVFHDYWIAVDGLDATQRYGGMTTSPRTLCGRYTGDFARACWYRALLEHPPARAVSSASDMLAVCKGLRGIQLQACVTGASVISSADPFVQMNACSHLPAGFEVSCARGVRIPGVALSPKGDRLGLISACGGFAASARSGCYAWLGKGLNVVTNGRFAPVCAELGDPAGRRACAAGAAAYRGVLVTFS